MAQIDISNYNLDGKSVKQLAFLLYKTGNDSNLVNQLVSRFSLENLINTKNNDGSWNVVSNSSKGFAGGGGGAVKQNYSVKKWQSVTDRNPSQTFAYRYIGPKQSSGQAA
jgi:hypothetical protein